jgi:hypothetical protein
MRLLELFSCRCGTFHGCVFAVSVCKGLALQKIRFKDVLVVGLLVRELSGFNALYRYILAAALRDI